MKKTFTSGLNPAVFLLYPMAILLFPFGSVGIFLGVMLGVFAVFLFKKMHYVVYQDGEFSERGSKRKVRLSDIREAVIYRESENVFLLKLDDGDTDVFPRQPVTGSDLEHFLEDLGISVREKPMLHIGPKTDVAEQIGEVMKRNDPSHDDNDVAETELAVREAMDAFGEQRTDVPQDANVYLFAIARYVLIVVLIGILVWFLFP